MTARGIAAGLAAAGIVAPLTGCGPDAAPSPSPHSNAAPVPADSLLRPVRIPFRDGIGTVVQETAAQAICQALSPAEWRDAIGSPVGRTVVSGVDFAECVVTGSSVRLHLSMGNDTRNRKLASTVGGRPADLSETGDVVAVLPAGEQDAAARTTPGLAPLLYARAEPVGAGEPASTLVRDVLDTVVPRLLPDGPAVPAADDIGRVSYTPTDPVAGVALSDLPAPVRGLVLATALTSRTARRLNL